MNEGLFLYFLADARLFQVKFLRGKKPRTLFSILFLIIPWLASVIDSL